MAVRAEMKCVNGTKSLEELANVLKKNYDTGFLFETDRAFDDVRLKLLSFESYGFRISSFLAITVLFTEHQNEIIANIICSGSGSGVINLSLGADTSTVKDFMKILRKYGFEETGAYKK